MVAGIGTIARVTVALWFRDIARVLRASRRQVIAGVLASAALAVMLGLMLALVAASHVTSDIPVELRATVLRTSFAGAVLSAGAIAVALCLSAPQRTALQNLLDLLPVSRVSARVGQLLPILLVGFVYSSAVSSTGILVLTRAAATWPEAVVGISTYLLLIAVTLVGTVSLYSLLSTASARLRLPSQYCTAMAGALALGVILACTTPDIFAVSPLAAGISPAIFSPHRAFAAAVQSPSLLRWGLVMVWTASGFVVAWVAAVAYRPEAKPRQLTLLRNTRPISRSPFWGCLWVETLVAIRNPPYLIAVVITPVSVVGVVLASLHPPTAIVAAPLAGSSTVLPFMLSLYAVGRFARFDWISTVATARPWIRIAPKAIACFMVASMVAVPAAVAYTATGLLSADDVGPTLLRWILATMVALVAGTVVPYSEQQQLSVAAGGFFLAVVYLIVSLGIGWLSQTVIGRSEAPLTFLGIVFFAGSYVLLNLRRRDFGAIRN